MATHANTTPAQDGEGTIAPKSKIRLLYDVWISTRNFYNSPGTEDGESPIFLAHVAAEDEIAVTPPTSIEDLALKIIVADDGSYFDLTEFQRELVRKAYQIAGVPDWTGRREGAE